MRVFGITGGIGTGKTFVLQKIAQAGYPTYSADERAKALMEESEELRQAILELFGAEAYTEDGRLNRAYMAARIFHVPELRLRLNALVHPATIADFARWVQQKTTEGYGAVFKEAALTIEAGAFSGLDALLLVYAPIRVRIERLRQRDALSEKDILQRLRAQWPEWKKASYADFILINDGHLPLEPQLRNFFMQYGLPVPPTFA